MKKFIRIFQNYLLIALPFVAAVIVWSELQGLREIESSSKLIRAVWEILSWNLMIWFSGLMGFLILLMAYPPAREQTLRRIANLKERDEREEYMTGQAARTSYISTLSLLLFLLFISMLQVNIKKNTDNEFTKAKHTLSISVSFRLLDETHIKKEAPEQILFDSKSISLSKPTVLLIALLWLLVSFRLSMKKQLKE